MNLRIVLNCKKDAKICICTDKMDIHSYKNDCFTYTLGGFDLVNNAKQLLVIGNGFDLHCGLKTDFKSYFEYIKDKETRSFWDEYCLLEKGQNISNWSSVEDILTEFFTNELYDISKYYNVNNKSINLSKEMNFIIKKINNEGILSTRNNIKKKVCDYLFKELQIFEENIKYYIFGTYSGQYPDVKKIGEYSKKDNIMSYMSCAEKLLNRLSKEHEYSLLTFNYTEWCSFKRVRDILNNNNKSTHMLFQELPPNCTSIINVHGSIDMDKVIIGIDNSCVNNSNRKYIEMFTKDKQHYSYFDKEATSLADWEKQLPEKIDQIIFYGHSLGNSDYSRFKKIFDKYKIKLMSTVLTFYYTNYDANDHKKEIECKVCDLLDRYGKDINESDIFKELKSKNKVHICELNDTNY